MWCDVVDKIWKCLFIKSEYLLSRFYCYWFVTRICWTVEGAEQAKISARLMFTYNMDSFYSLSYKTSISMPLVCWYVSRILDQLLLFSNNTRLYQAVFCFYYIVILMFNSYFYFVIQQPPNQQNQSQLVLSSNQPLLSNQPISLVIMTALARSHSTSTYTHTKCKITPP